MSDLIEQICETVRDAAGRGQALRPRGGGTKDFLGREPVGELLDTRSLNGVVSYDPSELVITVLAGTPLASLQQVLAAEGQHIPFEPPHFGSDATVGGCIASGLSGPARSARGGLRDYVLGVRIIDGRGDLLKFGGQVMKNVAGYDVPRLMSGSMGTLGLIVEVSLKVLPLPPAEASVMLECEADEAIRFMNAWSGKPLPISATSWHQGELKIRLSGATAAVESALRKLGGEALTQDEARAWWDSVREHQTGFHRQADGVLWRLAVPDTCAAFPGDWFIEWGGAQRWCHRNDHADDLHQLASGCGGHAMPFRGGDRQGAIYTTLSEPLMRIQRRLKQAFDPAGIFSPGRIYDGL